MISADRARLNRRAGNWRRALATADIKAQVIDTYSTVGGGSLPGQQLPTRALALQVSSPDALATQLRYTETPVISRIEADQVILDPRTVLPEQDKLLITMLTNALTK